MEARDPKPSMELHSRSALAPVCEELNRYAATMHFVGQSPVLNLTENRASGNAYADAFRRLRMCRTLAGR